MSASYRWSSRSSLSGGYDSRAFGLGSSGGSNSSSVYGSGSYGYGRSGGLGSSSSSSSRYGSGRDSLNTSRDYRTPRSYLSSLESSTTSTYPTRSSYLSSCPSSRSNLDHVSTRTGHIPSSVTSTYDSNESISSRRKTSLTDPLEPADSYSSDRKNFSDSKIVSETSDTSLKTNIYDRADDIKRERTSSKTDGLDRSSRRNEKFDHDISTQIVSGRTSIPSLDTSTATFRQGNASSRFSDINKGKTEDRSAEKDKYTMPSRYDSWYSRRRYSREADVLSGEPQNVGHFDRKLANYVQDCDVNISATNNRNTDIKTDSVCSTDEDGMPNGISGLSKETHKCQTTELSCKAPSSYWRSSTLSSSHFEKAEEDSMVPSDRNDVRRSITEFPREKPLDLYQDANQRSKLVNGSAKPPAANTTSSTNITNSGSNKRSSVSNVSQTKTAKEVVRLESLCEARTKELTHTKMQLKATSQGFDAMAVLLNYCCTELDAFQCPQLAQTLEKVQKQLADCLAEIGELTNQKEKLTENLTQMTKDKEEECKRAEEAIIAAQSEKEEHQRQQKEMDNTHNAALTAQRDELSTKHEDQTKKMKQKQDEEIKHVKESYERRFSAMKNENKFELSTLRLSHLEQIEALRAKHDSQMEELHKQHRNKLEDITHRFESIKVTLSEKVESLRGECDDLRVRARASEEALQKDADVKVQMALVPFLNLPKEIESLKMVLEMRNEEVQKLRGRNMDLEKQLEEIPIAREKIISLQQKVENLEAIINIKTDHEKQMHEKCQVLMRKYDRESRANKRLSMDYEQVMWRMSQSEYGSNESLTKRQLSRSPPRSETTSPDARRRHLSPNSNSDVTMRVKKRSSNSESDGERKLRSRSATFVLEKDENKDEQNCELNSTQSTPRRWKKKPDSGSYLFKGEAVDGNSDPRMCHSAGAELITAALDGSKQAWNITMSDSQSSAFNDEGMHSLPMESSGEMAASYARSISGVSDSGVYDSLTRSDMLNSSIISTDSEWMASTNVSMTLDSTAEEDAEPFISHGHKVSNSDTVLDMTTVQNDRNLPKPSSCSSSAASADETAYDKDKLHDITSYEFQLTPDDESENDVFTVKEVISKDSQSDDFIDKTDIEGDTSTSCNVEVSISHNDGAISSSQQSPSQ